MIIGITGSFGSGKTMAANMFTKYGFEVINADELYHYIYEKDESLKTKIIQEFGTLERNEIKKIVFKDSEKLKKLNKITHPIIIKEIKNKIHSIIKNHNKENNILKNNTKKQIDVNIVLDVPLLIEANMQNIVDKIIVVKCDEKTQIERLLKKGKYTKEEIKNVIKSQMPTEEKIKYADFVVDNSNEQEETNKQIHIIIGKLSKQKHISKTLKTPMKTLIL